MLFFGKKKLRLEIAEFAAAIGEIASRSILFQSKPVHIHVIVSPAAGFFTRKAVIMESLSRLRMILLDAAERRPPNPLSRTQVHIAGYKGHPAAIAAEITERMVLGGVVAGEEEFFFLTLGGDGTHLEVLGALIELPAHQLENITVFRLPLGTGNDGADAKNLVAAAAILFESDRREKVSALRISPIGLKPFYAFNIASLGIDAFVTRMTNRLKNCIPGDSYKLIADLSVLFYDLLYGVRPMKLETKRAGGRDDALKETSEPSVQRFEGRYILTAMGVTGNRTYGDHKRILPDDKNLCAVENRSLLKKLRLKPLLYSGRHLGEPQVLSVKTDGLVIGYGGRIPLQTDGEACVLSPENFPCRVEVVSTELKVLQGKT
jgi:diacylglycerol kinase family enzyme